jgi:excisionase family DNA binding protein
VIRLDQPGVFLDLADCAYLDPHLVSALRRGWGSVGDAPPPLAFLQFADLVHRYADQYRASVQAAPSPGTELVPHDGESGTLAHDPVRITSRKAAQVAGVDESYVRRLLRQGALAGVRSGRGAWEVDEAALQAWMRHRPNHDRKAPRDGPHHESGTVAHPHDRAARRQATA